jgi:hypothetical protein
MPTPPLQGGSVVGNANYTSTATRPPMRVVVVVEMRAKLMEAISPDSPVNVNRPRGRGNMTPLPADRPRIRLRAQSAFFQTDGM